MNGGNLNDFLIGGAGNDVMHGDDGQDTLYGQDGNDTMFGGFQDDYVNGGIGIDTIDGGNGDDILVGGAGADTINGGNQNDIIHGHGLTTTEIRAILAANPGVVYNQDTNSFYQFVNTNVNFASALAAANAITINGISGHLVNVTSAAENTFVASIITDNSWTGGVYNTSSNLWEWQEGADSGWTFSDVTGAAIGNSYENWAAGQPQNNTEYNAVFYTNGTWHDWPSTAGHSYVIEWDAGLINDDNAIDTLNGGNGNDHIYGYGGDDTLNGDDGNDTLNGGNNNDALYGQEGNDILNGGNGNDTLLGGSGDDTVNAGDGNDTIYGDGSNDRDQAIADILTANPSVVYNAVTDSFYQLVTTNANHATARANALATTINGVGGYLANITSVEENTFIDNLIVADTWIGGSDSAAEGVWIWQDGREAGQQFWSGAAGGSAVGGMYENWNGGEPNNSGNEDHATIRTNGTWNDLQGTSSRDYIIEWDADSVLNISAGDDILSGGDGDDTIYGDFNSTTSTLSTQGWFYQYYDLGTSPSTLATAGFTLNGGRDNTNTVTDTGITQDTDPNTFDTGDNFALKFTAILTVTTGGTYTFRTTSDDGSMLFLDSVQIVDNDGLHGAVTVTSAGQVLAAGTYTLEATFFERGGGQVMDIEMSGPDTGGSFVNLENYADVNSPFRVGALSDGDDIISGGDGLDTLYGGGGADEFVFEAASAFSDTDVIMDFSTIDGDALDISDIITGFSGTITDYVQFSISGGDTLVQVDANGLTGGSSFQTIASLDGITGLDVSTLYTDGNIIV